MLVKCQRLNKLLLRCFHLVRFSFIALKNYVLIPERHFEYMKSKEGHCILHKALSVAMLCLCDYEKFVSLLYSITVQLTILDSSQVDTGS